VLFGIDTSAKDLPWEYEELRSDIISVTCRSFLKRIPAISLLHLSAFKDYLLSWAKDSYQALDYEGFMAHMRLTQGRYSPRS